MVYNQADPKTPIAPKRLIACDRSQGDFLRPNPNSGVVWHYDRRDRDGDGKYGFEETLHRCLGAVAIDRGLLYVADYAGLLHCLDARSGKVHWTHDQLAACWVTPLIVGDRVYVADEDGDVTIFRLSAKERLMAGSSVEQCVYGHPISSKNRLYLATNNTLFAVGRSTDRQRPDPGWRSLRGGGENRGVAHGRLGSNLKLLWRARSKERSFAAAPLIQNGVVYAVDEEGTAYALELETGQVIWTYDAGEVVLSHPAVADGKLFLATVEGRVLCVDAARGEQLWSFTADSEVQSGVNLTDEFVLFATQSGSVYCLRIGDGKPRWQYTTGDQIRSTPTIADELVLVAGCDRFLHAVELKTGRPRFKVDMESVTMATPAVLDGMAWVGTEDGELLAIDIGSGTIKWRKPLGDQPTGIRSSAAVHPARLVVGKNDKRVYCVDPYTGEVMWTYRARAAIHCSPTIVGLQVYVASEDGRLNAFDLMTGKQLWQHELARPAVGAIAIDNQRLVVVNERGEIHCFAPEKR